MLMRRDENADYRWARRTHMGEFTIYIYSLTHYPTLYRIDYSFSAYG